VVSKSLDVLKLVFGAGERHVGLDAVVEHLVVDPELVIELRNLEAI
jgi:hypothetical protein